MNGFHAAIDTPNGRWLQGDFVTLEETWVWIASQFVALRGQYGPQEWFKVRIEEYTL